MLMFYARFMLNDLETDTAKYCIEKYDIGIFDVHAAYHIDNGCPLPAFTNEHII